MMSSSSQMSSSFEESIATTPTGLFDLPAEIWLQIYEILFVGSVIVTITSNFWRWKRRNRAILQTCRRTFIEGTFELYRQAQLVVSTVDDPTKLNTIPAQIRQRLQRIELVECDLDETQGRAAPDLALFPVVREVVILSNHRLDNVNRSYFTSASMDTDDVCRRVREHDFLLERMQAKTREVSQRQGWIDSLSQGNSRQSEAILVGTLWVSGLRPLGFVTSRNGQFALIRTVCSMTSYLRTRFPY